MVNNVLDKSLHGGVIMRKLELINLVAIQFLIHVFL